MGLFYAPKASGVDHLASTIEDALEVQPSAVADKPAEAKKLAAKARQDAASDSPVLLVGRVLVGIAIAATLIVAAIVLSQAVDNQAIADALRKAQTPGYVSPDLEGLKSVAEWLRTIAAAWSAALLTLLLSEKAGASK